MIFGIGHLALSTQNIDQGLEMLKHWNYMPEFVFRNIPNHEAKSPFLSEKSEGKVTYHDLALCRKKDSLAIELTAHTSFSEEEGHYRVIMDQEHNIRSVLIETHDLKQSETFWTQLGFKVIGRNQGFCFLGFMTPLYQSPVSLILMENKNKRKVPSKVDLKGFPCLAFLTTHVVMDRQLSWETPSDIFEMKIADRNLQICFLKGPDGECVEIIEVQR